MEILTNEEYSARRGSTYIGDHTYSLLNSEELKELHEAIKLAYPHVRALDRERTYFNLACQPVAAAQFVERVQRERRILDATARELRAGRRDAAA